MPGSYYLSQTKRISNLLSNILSDYHSGKWLGSRQIRCNWATKGAGTSDDKQDSDGKSVVELMNGTLGEQEKLTARIMGNI